MFSLDEKLNLERFRCNLLVVLKQVSCVKCPILTVFCQQYFVCSVQIKNWPQNAFIVTFWQLFDRNNFFESNERFFQKLKSSFEVQRGNRRLSEYHDDTILEVYNVLIHTRITTSKTTRDIQYSKLSIQVKSRVAKKLKNQDNRK